MTSNKEPRVRKCRDNNQLRVASKSHIDYPRRDKNLNFDNNRVETIGR